MENFNNGLKKFHFDNIYWSDPQRYDFITLYQIGDISCHGDYIIGQHAQQCYEISYIASGSGWYSTNGCIYPVKEGDLYINLPGEKHNGQSDSKNPFRYFYMGFIFNHLPNEENPFSHIERMMNKIVTPVLQDRLEIRTPFLKIMNEINSMNEYSQFMIKTYLNQILVLTYRNFCSDWEYRYLPRADEEDHRSIVYRAITYIESNIYAIDDLKQVADALGYSYSYLSHIFSQETGLTLQNYYLRKKMEKAIELLKDGEYNITLLADKLRYQSIHSFSKAFKKYTGLSPAQYQLINTPNKAK